MKKLLGILGAMGMIASTGASVVACGNKSSNGPGSDTEVNANNIDEKVKEYQKKLDRYNELQEKANKEKFTKDEKIEWIKLVVDILVMNYEICQIDKSKLPDDMTFGAAIETKEKLLKDLNENKSDEVKREFEDIWDEVVGYIDAAIAKYSK
ncbi:lipoprotein [Spiroplasma apis]|uniref:Lipoprotein n=1 Tax=Spiroplasma apis B31 TaxID=1276258 RepID=V5RJ89_SPIAP|nr:lipoprotein [Spiroplasma apis]AHB36619.1 hypothetical protein SAPIS_v1c07740 [Spiroplasma apis B31]